MDCAVHDDEVREIVEREEEETIEREGGGVEVTKVVEEGEGTWVFSIIVAVGVSLSIVD